MTTTYAYPQSRVARGVAILGTHDALGNQGARFRPAKIAIFAQGNADKTYSFTKRQVFATSEAGSVYGYGSPVHLMCKSLFPSVGSIPVTVYPLDQPAAGVAGGGDITPAIDVALTKPESYRFVVNNITTPWVSIATTDTVADICDKFVAAINGVYDLPCTATDNSTAFDVDCKWEGASGNNLHFTIEGPDNPSLSFTINDPADGSGVPDITSALAQIVDVWETHIINALDYTDSTELDEYSAFGEARRDAEIHKPCVVITGTAESTYATVTAVTDARKDDRTNVIVPNPGSYDLPFVIAAEVTREVAIKDNSNPAHDYGLLSLPGLTPGADSLQWGSSVRDNAVKAGCATTEVRDGSVKIGDIVTCYHPTGEEPPGYRYVCDFAKRSTIINELALEFDSAKWVGKPLIPDDQFSTNPDARKPKTALAALYRIIDNMANEAIISDPDFAKQASSAGIGVSNPKRLDVKLVAMLSGNANVISIDFSSGFYFGS